MVLFLIEAMGFDLLPKLYVDQTESAHKSTIIRIIPFMAYFCKINRQQNKKMIILKYSFEFIIKVKYSLGNNFRMKGKYTPSP